jgi:hypothetical protein
MAARRKVVEAATIVPAAPVAVVVRPTVGELARCPEPLHVVAHLDGAIVSAPMLDALLAYQVAQRAELPMYARPSEHSPIEIPIQRSPCGRFHLASAPQYSVLESEARHKSRRPVIAEAQMLAGPSVKRIDIQTGPSKGFRIPYSTHLLVGDAVHWWCLGDRERIVGLLSGALHLGNRRGAGHGWLTRWDVQPCEPWPGFPVVRDGKPLRALPLDWPGLVAPAVGLANVTYPFWDRETEQPCAVPG